MTLEEISDHIEIREVLCRYCRGIDRVDPKIIASIYHPGAIDNHGRFCGPGVEFAEWTTKKMMADTKGVGQHHMTNIMIELHGDVANVESYCIAYHPALLEDGAGEGLGFVGARLLDRFEKRNGEWKIADRRVIYDFTKGPSREVPWSVEDHGLRGKRGRQDPSHGFLTGVAGTT
jgi:hypothetical protein